jgi:amphi-Trp domain-containing protein
LIVGKFGFTLKGDLLQCWRGGRIVVGRETPSLQLVDPMPARKRRSGRDVEKNYPVARFIEKLRRLADALEEGERFRIQVAGERVSIPPDAVINIEHERGEGEEEIEFQLKWPIDD